jgi:hypothetical protein
MASISLILAYSQMRWYSLRAMKNMMVTKVSKSMMMGDDSRYCRGICPSKRSARAKYTAKLIKTASIKTSMVFRLFKFK